MGIGGFGGVTIVTRVVLWVYYLYKGKIFLRIFPSEEKFGIISQVRRAAVSVPSNIAEGFGRNKRHPKELIHFLHYSQGSLSEIETLLELCKLLGFINESTFNSLNIQLINIRTMLVKLISSIEK